MSASVTTTHVITCDGPKCSRAVSSNSRLAARATAEADGWRRDGRYDYCPHCRPKVGN
jgi:hypothetical protein